MSICHLDQEECSFLSKILKKEKRGKMCHKAKFSGFLPLTTEKAMI